LVGHEWLEGSEARPRILFKQTSGQRAISFQDRKLSLRWHKKETPAEPGFPKTKDLNQNRSGHLEDLLSGGVERQRATFEACHVEFLVGWIGADDTTGFGGFFAFQKRT
jgi:hypothetical protein